MAFSSSSSSSSSPSNDGSHFDTSEHFQQYEKSLEQYTAGSPSSSSASTPSSSSPSSGGLQWSASSGVGGLGVVPNGAVPSGVGALPHLQLPSASPSVRSPEYIGSAGHGVVRERAWHEKITYETGASYVAGGLLGAVYGSALGLREAKQNDVYGKSFKLTWNSVLNHAGKNSTEFGNRFAVFAAFFSLSRTISKSFRDKNDVKNDLIGFTFASTLTSIPRLGLLAACKVGAIASLVGTATIAARIYYAENRDVNKPPPQWIQNVFTTFSKPPPMPPAYPTYPMYLMSNSFAPQPPTRT